MMATELLIAVIVCALVLMVLLIKVLTNDNKKETIDFTSSSKETQRGSKVETLPPIEITMTEYKEFSSLPLNVDGTHKFPETDPASGLPLDPKSIDDVMEILKQNDDVLAQPEIKIEESLQKSEVVNTKPRGRKKTQKSKKEATVTAIANPKSKPRSRKKTQK